MDTTIFAMDNTFFVVGYTFTALDNTSMSQITHFLVGLIQQKNALSNGCACYPTRRRVIQREYVLSSTNKYYPTRKRVVQRENAWPRRKRATYYLITRTDKKKKRRSAVINKSDTESSCDWSTVRENTSRLINSMCTPWIGKTFPWWVMEWKAQRMETSKRMLTVIWSTIRLPGNKPNIENIDALVCPSNN